MREEGASKFQQTFILLLLVGAIFSFVGMIESFLVALLLAAIFSGMLYPYYIKLLQLFKGREFLAAISVIAITIFAVGIPLLTLLGMVTSEAIQVSQKAQPIVEKLLENKHSLGEQLPSWVPLKEELKSFDEALLAKASQVASSMGKWLVASFSSATKGTLEFLINLFVMLYAMFYFLLYGKTLLKRLYSLLPLKKDDYYEVMNRALMVTRASFKGIIIIGLIQGFLVGIAFWMLEIESSVFWGSVVFFLSAVPGLGAPLVWIPAAVYLFMTGSVAYAIALSLWGIIVVGLIDNILRPWIVGSDAKLPDLIILISILGGISTLGAVGIIIGPVIAALLDTILNIYKKTFKAHLGA